MFSGAQVHHYDPAAPLASRLAAIEAGLRNEAYQGHRFAREARHEILVRRERSKWFDGIDESAWGLLLQIYLAEHAGMTPMLGSMIRSSDIGFETAERILPSLIADDWIELAGSEYELWLANTQLTSKAKERIEKYFRERECAS